MTTLHLFCFVLISQCFSISCGKNLINQINNNSNNNSLMENSDFSGVHKSAKFYKRERKRSEFKFRKNWWAFVERTLNSSMSSFRKYRRTCQFLVLSSVFVLPMGHLFCLHHGFIFIFYLCSNSFNDFHACRCEWQLLSYDHRPDFSYTYTLILCAVSVARGLIILVRRVVVHTRTHDREKERKTHCRHQFISR